MSRARLLVRRTGERPRPLSLRSNMVALDAQLQRDACALRFEQYVLAMLSETSWPASGPVNPTTTPGGLAAARRARLRPSKADVERETARRHGGGPAGAAALTVLEEVFRDEWARVLASLVGYLGDFDACWRINPTRCWPRRRGPSAGRGPAGLLVVRVSRG